MSQLPLEELFCQQHPSCDTASLAEKLRAAMEEVKVLVPSMSLEERMIGEFKHLLTLQLLHMRFKEVFKGGFAAKCQQMTSLPWNRSSSFLRILVALNCFAAGLPLPDPSPHVLEGGAIPISIDDYSPFLALPYQPQHLELGVFLILLALWTHEPKLIESALSVAKWQLQLLDQACNPLKGLFARAQDENSFETLFLLSLLFKGIDRLVEDPLFLALGDQFELKWRALTVASSVEVAPLWVLIEPFLISHPASAASDALPEAPSVSKILDVSTGLVGKRSLRQNIFCTLHGGYTGLGSIRIDDVELLTYGPHYWPLEEVAGFGIEANHLSQQGVKKNYIHLSRDGFVARGCVRMVDQPPLQLGGMKRFRGIWLELVQEFKPPFLEIDVAFLGLAGFEGVFFTFFVKANSCKIMGSEIPLSTLVTSSSSLVVEGETGKMMLEPLWADSQLQVLSLKGQKEVWGADWLIAYPLRPEQLRYQWQIKFESKMAN